MCASIRVTYASFACKMSIKNKSNFSDPVQNMLPAVCEPRQVVAILLCVREKGALEN